ncbi:MAG: organic solvent transporter substrate-binding protein [Conexibacter sp.]|nr:organic solvent transporter substrate-binding protein [Conexibacter sp.]
MRTRVGLVLAAGVAFLVAVALLATGGEDGYLVRAEFVDAGGVRKNSDVKVGEVPAGRIVAVDLTKGDSALVTMRLDKGVGPIGAGAVARSRPVNLLGEKYVDLDVGDQRRPLKSGATIPSSQTDSAVELDDVLNTLQPDTRAALRVLINEAGVSLSGRGNDFNRLLAQLPGGLHEATRFLDTMSRDTDRLEALIVDGDRVLEPIAGRRDDLGRLVERADAALATVAERRADLGRTLATAPGALRQLRTSLTQLQRAGEALRPAAANLRLTAVPLADTLKRVPAFAEDARGTLEAARKVAPALGRLGREGTRPVRQLRTTLDRLGRFAGDLAPTISTLDEGAMKELVRFMNNWSTLTQTRDGIGHIFRVRLVVGPEFFTRDGTPEAQPAKRGGTKQRPGPAKATAPQPSKPAKPTGGTPAPARTPVLPKVLLDPPKSVQDVLDGVLGSRSERQPPVDVPSLLNRLLGN